MPFVLMLFGVALLAGAAFSNFSETHPILFYTLAGAGLVLFTVGLITKPFSKPAKILKSIGNGLYENTNPPQNQDFPIFTMGQLGGNRQNVILHYYSRLAAKHQTWHGFTINALQIEDPGYRAMARCGLEDMIAQGIIEKIEAPDPDHLDLPIWVYFPCPGFEELLQ